MLIGRDDPTAGPAARVHSRPFAAAPVFGPSLSGIPVTGSEVRLLSFQAGTHGSDLRPGAIGDQDRKSCQVNLTECTVDCTFGGLNEAPA